MPPWPRSTIESVQLHGDLREANGNDVPAFFRKPATVDLPRGTPETTAESIIFAATNTNLTSFLEILVEKAKEEGFHVVLERFEDDDFNEREPGSITYATVETNLAGLLGELVGKAKDSGVLDFLDGYEDDISAAVSSELTPPSNPRAEVPSPPRKKVVPNIPSPQTPSLSSSVPTKDPIGSLAALLSNTSLTSSWQQNAKRIIITKAFNLTMLHAPKCHYDHLAIKQAGMNNRRFAERKRKRGDFGFKPDEVINQGALHTADPEMKFTLTGKVHAIFDETHFTDVPHDVYEKIKPALLLATKFLTTPQCLQHFHTVLMGNREICSETIRAANCTQYRIRKDVPITPWSLLNLNRHIDSLAEALTWQFLDAGIFQGEPDIYHATAKIIPCKHNRSEYLSISNGSNDSLQKTLISIHPDFFVEAKRLCTLQYPDTAQALRFQFFLAINIMHEFAHAFEIARAPEDAWYLREVFMYESPIAESGRAWEASILGAGYCASINARADGLVGLALMQWPPSGLRDASTTGQDEVWAIPMAYIHRMMQQPFWDELSTKPCGDQTLFHVPKTGAKSVGLVSLTTVTLEDVLSERPMADMEVALREVVGYEDEEERESKRRRVTSYAPKSWKQSMGRRGGM